MEKMRRFLIHLVSIIANLVIWFTYMHNLQSDVSLATVPVWLVILSMFVVVFLINYIADYLGWR